MRKYKAMVIDGRKWMRRAILFLVLGLGALLLIGNITKGSGQGVGIRNPEKIIGETVPALSKAKINIVEVLQEKCKKCLAFFLQFDLWEPSTVLATEIPVSGAVKQDGIMGRIPMDEKAQEQKQEVVVEETRIPEVVDIPVERQAPIKEVDARQKVKGNSPVTLSNETSYQIDVKDLLEAPVSIQMDGEGPKVLVIHTHATETYAPEGATVYDTEGNDRTEDTERNVVRIGKELTRILEEKGIETIHDTKLHDTPSFNGSYASSLKAMESYLEKYPSIQVILDIHRDSIVYEDGTKAKVVTEIGGKKTAQLMFVVGTDQKGLEHPDWKENIKSAIHFQNAICQKYPGLMRHINLRRERFNGHMSKAGMIIEVGSGGNSLSEAIQGIAFAGECIGDYLNSL